MYIFGISILIAIIIGDHYLIKWIEAKRQRLLERCEANDHTAQDERKLLRWGITETNCLACHEKIRYNKFGKWEAKQ